MQDELYAEFMKGYQLPGDLGALVQNVAESPPDSEGLRNALSYYMSNFNFPEIQTALQAGGVGAYDMDPSETIPKSIMDFLSQSAFRQQQKGGAEDYDEKTRQARIFLSLLQGGGGPRTPFSE